MLEKTGLPSTRAFDGNKERRVYIKTMAGLSTLGFHQTRVLGA